MSNDQAESIRRQMRMLREELNEDVGEIVENARTMADWHYYVRRYPWFCMGACVLAGYFLVPNRYHIIRPDADTLAKMAVREQVFVRTKPRPEPTKPRNMLFSMLVNTAARGLLTYGMQRLGTQLGHLTSERTEPHATTAPSPSANVHS
jgi:hypothetical protein